MQNERQTPRVSIGLPVYNGENYLAEAIDSILAQTFQNFELIISDNASTDGTEEMCRDYAARDSRIRYIRQDRNLGAAPNYNKTYAVAVGEYFRWHAHDDVLKNTYLEKCVAALDRDPDAVFCHSDITIIDENGAFIENLPSEIPGTMSKRVSNRFRATLRPHKGANFFGLMRRKALEGTPLHGNYPGSDKVFLMSMAIRGRFVFIDEPLFMNRRHPDQFQKAVSRADRIRWFDRTAKKRVVLPALRVWLDASHEMRRHVNNPRERYRCYIFLAEYWTHLIHLRWLRQDIILAIFGPRGTGYRFLRHRLKERLTHMQNHDTGSGESIETSAPAANSGNDVERPRRVY